MKKQFWSRDWFVGLVITIIFLLLTKSAFFDRLELSAYDLGIQMNSSGHANEEIAIIAIDDESLANIGRWPWARDIHAKMIDLLAQGGAKVIGHTVLFIEPQVDSGQDELFNIRNMFDNSSLNTRMGSDLARLNKLIESLNNQAKDLRSKSVQKSITTLNDYFIKSSLADGKVEQDVELLRKALQNAGKNANKDIILKQSIANAGNVVLAMPMVPGNARGNPNTKLPDYILKNSLSTMVDNVDAMDMGWFPFSTIDILPPLQIFSEKALAIGHLNVIPNDADSVVRTDPLALLYYGNYIPSLSLQVVSRYLNLKQGDIELFLGEKVQLGGLVVNTSQQLLMNTFFYGEKNEATPFIVDSFYDVLNNKIPVTKYKDKIVLIGATAAGIGDHYATPLGNMSPVLALAHAVSSILNEDFYISPLWGVWVTYGAFLLVALYLTLLFPRLKAGMAAAFTGLLFLAFLGAEQGLLQMQAIWLKLTFPAFFLLVGHLLLTTKHFLVTEKSKEKVEAQSAHSNQMLGLQFQEKGQLDMAFDAFRKVPIDKQLMDNLYNLALDYERKRLFNKAGFVYQYMSGFDGNFRDIKERSGMNKVAEGTVVLQTGSSPTVMSTVAMNGPVEKPMLGRYVVEKELGKGAMGVVYLGKDPKINRVVAIKTMALANEFEEDELEEVKSRFFREAESAGRLNHPNIVTIFDAGEEHDLAYIAMEFLKGGDLAPFTKREKLLPVYKVLGLMMKAAQALHYAHQNNVVHRDIKPANIMYDPETGVLKLTDFGVARITDSSKTKTGVLMGTPSYMSPEQVTGKKVDGRSDIFSLGIVMYILLTTELPFKAPSMANLMYMIASEPHTDILKRRPKLPKSVKMIIDKSLVKDENKRYQNGEEMARDLLACQKLFKPVK